MQNKCHYRKSSVLLKPFFLISDTYFFFVLIFFFLLCIVHWLCVQRAREHEKFELFAVYIGHVHENYVFSYRTNSVISCTLSLPLGRHGIATTTVVDVAIWMCFMDLCDLQSKQMECGWRSCMCGWNLMKKDNFIRLVNAAWWNYC